MKFNTGNPLGIKLCSFPIKNNPLGELQATVNMEKSHFNNRFFTAISDNKNQILGTDAFCIYAGEKLMTDNYMQTNSDLRKKFRIGELLRLTSIIEMFENGLNKIELASKEGAVFFHSKYDFKPEIKQFRERDGALRTIMKDSRFPDLVEKAELIQKQIKETNSYGQMRELTNATSALMENYLSKVKSLGKDAYKDAIVCDGFDMVLTKDSVLENKEKYNTLFKNHGIDYQI